MTLQEELEAEAKNTLLLPHPWFQLKTLHAFPGVPDPQGKCSNINLSRHAWVNLNRPQTCTGCFNATLQPLNGRWRTTPFIMSMLAGRRATRLGPGRCQLHHLHGTAQDLAQPTPIIQTCCCCLFVPYLFSCRDNTTVALYWTNPQNRAKPLRLRRRPLRLQNRAVRLVTGLSRQHSSSDAYKKLKVLKFNDVLKFEVELFAH